MAKAGLVVYIRCLVGKMDGNDVSSLVPESELPMFEFRCNLEVFGGELNENKK